MGMAAGQARLLSITSRMSDNELRAQIINNNKMRLATQSSQVSEAYVTALNEAQMMFTNYDKDNNTSYQRLTYNALTAYNPYNNQYIVTNASGNVLLSEADAVKYKNANGDVDKFLQSYGLERTTTYFDNLAAHAKNGAILFKTGIIYEDGTEAMGEIKDPNGSTDAKAIAKYIQDLYEGNLTDTYGSPAVQLHPGYMNAVASEDYYNYTKLLGDYTVKKDAYIETIASKMAERLTQSTKDGVFHADYNGAEAGTLKDISTRVKSATDIATMQGCLTDLSSFISNVGAKYCADGANNSVIKSLKASVDGVNNGTVVTTTFKRSKDADGNDTSNCKFEKDGDKLILKSNDGETICILTTPVLGAYTAWEIPYEDDSGNAGSLTGVISALDPNIKYHQDAPIASGHAGDATKDFTITLPSSIINSASKTADALNNDDSWQVTFKSPNSLEVMRDTANKVIQNLESQIYSIWDPANAAFRDTSDPTYSAYIDAAKKLSQQIFGKDVGADNYALLDDIEECFNKNLKGEFQGDKRKDFQKIYDAYLLDCVMNTYGEPKYAWISNGTPKNPRNELTDPSYNENGDAKAQWYQNLFERIKKGGFKVIQDGLASSPEWMQFAFESGIITMEQVDANKNWQPLIYSNCSDITEQTNDAAIAKAEAEYKSAMNKIENKDKRYDLELKNIDTEHNSLQVEYDSIKTAIDKNIERTFKLYS